MNSKFEQLLRTKGWVVENNNIYVKDYHFILNNMDKLVSINVYFSGYTNDGFPKFARYSALNKSSIYLSKANAYTIIKSKDRIILMLDLAGQECAIKFLMYSEAVHTLMHQAKLILDQANQTYASI
jgi:hypothetical protein